MLYDDLFRPMVEQPGLILPSYLVAGDQWQFSATQETGDAGSTATMVFASGSQSISADAAGDGSSFDFTFAGTDTAKLLPSPYQWTLYLTDTDGNRSTRQFGAVPVVASPGSQAWTDAENFLTEARKACEQAILDLLNQRVQMVSFGGKQYYLWDVEKLWKLRNELWNKEQLVNQELTGNKRSRLILPWFVIR